MGMSASQARLIALTARLSDTEYEAQQINQQRLTLSNKMNEIQNQLYDMKVPTPPSKIDFAVDAYAGKIGTQSVSVRMNDDGTFTATKTQKGWSANTGSDRLSKNGLDPKQYLGDRYEKDAFVPYNAADFELIVTKEDGIQTPWWGGENGKATGDDIQYVSGTYYSAYVQTTEGVVPAEGAEEITISASDPQDIMLLSPEAQVYGNLKTEYCVGSKPMAAGEKFEPNHEYRTVDGTVMSYDQIKSHNDKAKELASKSFAVENTDGSYTVITAEQAANGDYAEVIEVTNPQKFETALETVGEPTVGGNKTLDYSAAESQYGSTEEFKNAVTGLKNMFAAQGHTADLSSMTVIVSDSSNGLKFSFCLTEDLQKASDNSQIRTYDPYHGDVDIVDNDAKLKYDTNGNVESVTFIDDTGKEQSAKLSANTTAYDEISYDAAMRQYDREKIAYDHEQNELNKQTSIYQRQDKQLELKLTRLDSERNALNTELEAVKKVIQDSIDRGFKTFSG